MHNRLRNRHQNTNPLMWDVDIAAAAQSWANQLAQSCNLVHNTNDPYGENLFRGPNSLADAVLGWYEEDVLYYDGRQPDFYMDTGHMTQIAWAGSQRVGCGKSFCNNNDEIYVCQYFPPGNVDNRFPENVLPLKPGIVPGVY